MTVYGYRGQIVHHNDCTYCKHRYSLPMPRKGRKPSEQERCRISGLKIRGPREGLRWCEHYQQVGCECPACNDDLSLTVKDNIQMEVSIDK